MSIKRFGIFKKFRVSKPMNLYEFATPLRDLDPKDYSSFSCNHKGYQILS